MNVNPDQAIENSKAGVSLLLNVAQIQFAAFERMSALNFNLTKSIYEDSVGLLKSMSNAKDAKELGDINTAVLTPAAEKSLAYTRGLLDEAVRTQTAMNEIFESHARKMSEGMQSVLKKMADDGVPGMAVGHDAVKSALTASTDLYGRMNAMAKQAHEVAEANLTTLSAVAKEVKRKSA